MIKQLTRLKAIQTENAIGKPKHFRNPLTVLSRNHIGAKSTHFKEITRKNIPASCKHACNTLSTGEWRLNELIVN